MSLHGGAPGGHKRGTAAAAAEAAALAEAVDADLRQYAIELLSAV